MLQPELAREYNAAIAQNRALVLTTGFARLTHQSDSFKLYLRYFEQCRREYREAREELRELVKLRPALAESEFTIPDPMPAEPMPPPPPADECEPASPYDPTASIHAPVLFPHTAKRQSPQPKRKYIEEQPRFGHYPKGDEVPDAIRRAEMIHGKPPTD